MLTNNILFINHSEQACGVQQYGKRVAQIFKRSTVYNVHYAEPKNVQEFSLLIQALAPRIIIYNYLQETMPWLAPQFIEQVREMHIAQGLIVHNVGYAPLFDFYLHQNPSYPRNGNSFPLLRPLFDCDNYARPYTEIPSIGTFGFGMKCKRYDEICKLVNEQFEEANIRMHLTLSHFRPNQQELLEVQKMCHAQITKPKINLTFTSDFRSDEQIVSFLASNSINVFLYQNYDCYNGISSVIDYALSAGRPLAVCKSNMFSHINDFSPSICVEDATLPQIIEYGPIASDWAKVQWSNRNFVHQLEGTLTDAISSAQG